MNTTTKMHGRKATRAENNRNKKKKDFSKKYFVEKKKKSPIRYVWCIVDCRYLLVIRRRVWGDVVSDEAYYIRKKGASHFPEDAFLNSRVRDLLTRWQSRTQPTLSTLYSSLFIVHLFKWAQALHERAALHLRYLFS